MSINKRKKVRLREWMVKALVEAVRWSEKVKPSQHAKREVFRKYRIYERGGERLLTALFYDILKKMGLIDRIIEEGLGLKPIYILDPWLRAALRVAVEILVFKQPSVCPTASYCLEL